MVGENRMRVLHDMPSSLLSARAAMLFQHTSLFEKIGKNPGQMIASEPMKHGTANQCIELKLQIQLTR
jgi:hypothetical protein